MLSSTLNKQSVKNELLNVLNNSNDDFKNIVCNLFYKFTNQHATYQNALELFGIQNIQHHLNHLVEFNYPNYKIAEQIKFYDNLHLSKSTT